MRDFLTAASLMVATQSFVNYSPRVRIFCRSCAGSLSVVQISVVLMPSETTLPFLDQTDDQRRVEILS
jgi:hypothetical protein